MREYNKRFFIETLDDIRAKMENGSDYHIMRATGLLRHLFLDQTPLVNSVKREYGMKVKFPISKGIDISKYPPGLTVSWSSIEPAGNPERNYEASLKQLLKTKILYVTDDEYTVRDIIHISANQLGGIHSKEVVNDRENKLLQLKEYKENIAQKFGIKTIDVKLTAIRDIVRVSIRGLERLEKRVRRDLKEST